MAQCPGTNALFDEYEALYKGAYIATDDPRLKGE
jgi:hypothetical protein